MSFSESVRTCLRKYADFNGRASRPEYWWFFLFSFVTFFVSDMVAVAAKAPALAVLPFLFLFGLFLPLLSAAVRRLHDTRRSGWYYLMGLVPYVGGIVLLVFLAGKGNPTAN